MAVTIASDQDALAVSGTVAATQSGTWTEANSATRLSESDFDTKTGSLTETAPGTDTASSGLNGRLQRIAQRLTTLLAVFPATIDTNSGNKSASTLRVVLATDQPTLSNTQPVSLASVPSHEVTNAGAFAVQVDGAALTALQLIDDAILADDAAFTPASSKVMMAGFEADEGSTDSVDEGDGGAARMTLDRKQIVTVQPHTAGGWSTFNATSGDGSTALTNSAQAVKASAGQLGGYYIYNPNASVAYVILYDVAQGSVTVGTTNPKMVLAIPAGSAANLEIVNGIPFGTAITVAAATTGAGNTAPSSALDAMFWYK